MESGYSRFRRSTFPRKGIADQFGPSAFDAKMGESQQSDVHFFR